MISAPEEDSIEIEIIDYDELDNSNDNDINEEKDTENEQSVCVNSNGNEINEEKDTENDQSVCVNSNENEDDTVINILKENDVPENIQIKNLVCDKFGFDEWVLKRIIANGFDLDSLKLATDSELKDLFPRPFLGLRAKFKHNLNAWRRDASTSFRQNCKCQWLEWNNLTRSPSCATEKSLYSPSTSLASVELFNRYTLTELLNGSEKGVDVLNFYKNENVLDEEHKNILISIIVDSFESNLQGMKMKDIENAVDKIQEIFPTENQQYYLNRRGHGLNPTGKLHDKAVNARIRLRKLRGSTPIKPIENNSETAPSTPEPEILSTELEETVLWLAHNNEPWSDVERKWGEVLEIRQNDIKNGKNILERWPLFKNVLGHALVDFDYSIIKKDNPSKLLQLWPTFVEKIVPYFKKSVKDKTSLTLLKQLKNNINTNSRDSIIFQLLHAILKPPMLAVGKKGAKRYKWKPSISDAQESCFIYCNSVAQYSSKVELLRRKYEDLGLTLQPLIIAIGEDRGALDTFYTYYDGILYKFNSFLKCIDITLKLFQVMNFSYPKEGKNVYTFLENYFYNITSDVTNPVIDTLLLMLSK